jgi:predicted permease
VTAALPLVLALTLVAGLLAGRRRDLSGVARRIQTSIWWFGLPLGIPVLASAPLGSASLAVLAGAGAFLAVPVIASLYARQAFDSRAERAAFTLTALWPNTGALGIPVTFALLGPDAVPAAALYGSLIAGPLSLIVGGSIASGTGERRSVREIVASNPALITVAVGLAWALAPLPAPERLAHFSQSFMVGTSFLSFLAAGITMSGAPLALDRDVAAAVTLRVGVSPTLLLAAATVVHVPRGFLVQAAMASGLSTFNLASAHDLPLARVAPAFAWSTGIVLSGAFAYLALF